MNSLRDTISRTKINWNTPSAEDIFSSFNQEHQITSEKYAVIPEKQIVQVYCMKKE